jgi:hypothetical protein
VSANFDRAYIFDLAEITTTSTIVLFSLALLNFSIHLLGIGRYGFFRDELYYLACGQHLAWGYVDQPPLIAVAAWVSQHAFGTSLAATRLLPAAAGALLVLLTGLLTRELGGSLRAQVLAAITILFAPAVLAMNSFLSMNAFEPVFWALGAILIARILNGGSSRLWLWFGLVTGIAFLNKHTILVFGFATVVALLASGLPREFTRRWIWLGGAIALAIFLPNLIWEARNHWPQIEVVRNDRAVKTLALSPLQYLWEQVLFMSPVSVPVALSGLVWFFSGVRGKQFRPLGYVVLCSAAIFIFFQGKAYYLLPAYPILFAAGGIALEPFLFAGTHEWRGKTYVAVLILAGLVTLPFGVPVLPLDSFLSYQRMFPLTHDVKSERDSTSELPQLYADEFGWPEMTATIARIYYNLPPAERYSCAILAGNYGEAGAIDLLGRAYGIPNAISPHNSYYFWGPRDYTGDCVILFGERAEFDKQFFGDVRQAAVISNPYAMPNEIDLPVYVCRRPKMPLSELWPQLRFYL